MHSHTGKINIVVILGAGPAVIPRAIVAWARQSRLPVSLTAVDRNDDTIRLARELARDWPEIHFEQHDLRRNWPAI